MKLYSINSKVVFALPLLFSGCVTQPPMCSTSHSISGNSSNELMSGAELADNFMLLIYSDDASRIFIERITFAGDGGFSYGARAGRPSGSNIDTLRLGISYPGHMTDISYFGYSNGGHSFDLSKVLRRGMSEQAARFFSRERKLVITGYIFPNLEDIQKGRSSDFFFEISLLCPPDYFDALR